VALNRGDARGDTYANIEWIRGSRRGDDIFGDATLNILDGNSGNDTLDGRDGDDTLLGSSGNDSLLGGLGADTLTGGGGRDSLFGGDDADVFKFNSTGESNVGRSGRDVVTDFVSGEDVIDLFSIDADTTTAADQEFDFIDTADFSRTAGELRFVNGILSGDVNGDGRADFAIELRGVATLTDADFIL
jgi:serralysin